MIIMPLVVSRSERGVDGRIESYKTTNARSFLVKD